MSSELDSSIHSRLAHLARTMHSVVSQGTQDVLEAVAASAVEAVPAAVSAGVILVAMKISKSRVVTVGGTDDDANTFDRLQEAHGDGPCLAAAWGDELVVVKNFDTESRWRDPVYVSVADPKALSSKHLWSLSDII